MATLAEFRAQYPQYDAVPDIQLADSLHEKFYAKMPKMEFYKTIGLGSAAAIPGAENVVTNVKQPEVSMRDRIMGVIETPLAIGATLGGAAIAPIVGAVGTLTSGKYGTQEGIRAGEEAMKAVPTALVSRFCSSEPRVKLVLPLASSWAVPVAGWRSSGVR